MRRYDDVQCVGGEVGDEIERGEGGASMKGCWGRRRVREEVGDGEGEEV